MKKLFNLFAIAAIAVFTLAGCSKNDQNAPASDSETVHITVKANVQDLAGEPGTKTYIDGTNTIIWGTGEYMNIAIASGENTVFAKSNDASADAFNGEAQATFGFDVSEIDQTASEYTYMGMYPSSAAVTTSNDDPAAYKVFLPSTQSASANSYDPSAYIMVCQPKQFSTLTPSWMATYRRATALNKVTLTNIPEDIVSVEFTAPAETYMAGRRYIDLTTGESGELYGDTRTETIEVKANLSGDNKVVWFTSWETAIPAGSKLKIVAKSATKKYTREIEARTDGINFKEGYLNTLKVNMASADVDDIDDLSGNYLILASKDYWQIMANINSGSNYSYYTRVTSSIASSVSNITFADFSGINNIEDYIWTVSKLEGGYSFKNNGSQKYLALPLDENKAFESDNPEAFSLSISEDNSAEIKSNTYTSRVLRYNANQNQERFAFYNGTQQSIYMIKAVIEPRCADPVISYNEDTEEVTITCATEGAKIAYTLDGTDPTTDNNGPTGTTILYEGPFTISGQTTVKAISGGLSGYLNSYIVTQVCGSLPPASDGTILWAESFSGFSANDVPSASNSQTTVYGDGILTYICDEATKVYSEALAGGSSPELLVSKSNGSFTVSDIPTGAASTMTLTFKSNHPEYITVSSSTTGVIISEPSYNSGVFRATITVGSSVDSFSLTFTNTKSSNARVDDFNLVVGTPAVPKHTITFTQPTTGGSFAVTANGSTLESGADVEEGTIVTLTATAEDGFNFTGWTVTGATVSGNTANATFTMGTSDVTIAAAFSSQTGEKTATILFGSASGSTNINDLSVTGSDNQGNTWTITTVMNEKSFSPQPGYAQIGAAKKPATSITFTTTLPSSVNVKSFSAKFGGYSGTAGDVELKVGDTVVGTGALNATNDVTVQSTVTASGTVLTVTVTNIAKGVKVYNITVTYE